MHRHTRDFGGKSCKALPDVRNVNCIITQDTDFTKQSSPVMIPCQSLDFADDHFQ